MRRTPEVTLSNSNHSPACSPGAERLITIDDVADSPMTPADKNEFKACLRKLHGGTSSMAQAFTVIVEKRLYRERYPSFKAFARAESPIGRAYVLRLVQAQRILVRATFVDAPRPANILQAIALEGIHETDYAPVMREAQELAGAGKITATIIKRIVRERKGTAYVEPQGRRIDVFGIEASNPAPTCDALGLAKALREKFLAGAGGEEVLTLIDGIVHALGGNSSSGGQNGTGQPLEWAANQTPDEPTLAAHNVKQPEAPMPSSESNQNL